VSVSAEIRDRASKDILHRLDRPAAEIAYTSIGLLITIAASTLLAMEITAIAQAGHNNPGLLFEQVAFSLIAGGLIYGNLIYLLTRISYIRRLIRHRSAAAPDLSLHLNGSAPRVTVLVPSYREETRVIRQSLLSAALQRYPRKRVVLLIDDPPTPRSAGDRDALQAARALPAEMQCLLQARADRIVWYAGAMRRRTAIGIDLDFECRELARVYAEVAAWLITQSREHPHVDHSDRLFTRVTYEQPSAFYLRRAAALYFREKLDLPAIEQAYHSLESVFRVEMASFERKTFANLSHEPNKAMNLNSYIALIGGAYVRLNDGNRTRLEKAPPESADVIVPDTDYLITLDADSILDPDYALRLVHSMEEPGNERIAVVQTPYSAVPQAPGLLERIAGATTDIQYNIHQGFADHSGTYWVGANALLRMQALRDICETKRINGIEIKHYISDRTVIEDTESTVDLLAKGWQLHNFPERLSYSATPPDFGSLLVQRRRWCNGGLIILPKLLRHLYWRRNPWEKTREGFFRIHYLVSPTVVNFGVPILLIHPFERNLESPWLALTALPYFFFYGRDMMLIGYRPLDLLRVYALNLMLIPVNLGGVLLSMRQIVTGRRVAFQRTPKTNNETRAPHKYIVAVYVCAAFALLSAVVALIDGLSIQPILAAFTGGLFLYAIFRFLHVTPPVTTALPKSRAAPFKMRPCSERGNEQRPD
jgi:cellulose synthase/poly-beta-1,6-N-acetylglucosamine synthase-like glycosyltransferase